MVTGAEATPTVVIVGSLNADILLDVARLPSAGETVIAHGITEGWGGKGANQAVAAASLGARTILVGAVGRDSRGAAALAELRRSGVNTSGVVQVDEPTGIAHVLREPAGENMIVLLPSANDALDADHVRNIMMGLDVRDAVVVSNFEILDAAVSAAATVCAERGWHFVLNPGPARWIPQDLLATVSVLTPNATEVLQLGASSIDELLTSGLKALVVTRGAAGVDLYADGNVHHLPAFAVNVVDAVGAGGAFTAGVAVGLAPGERLQSAVRLGLASAAIAVTGTGARGAQITMSSVRELVDHRGDPSLCTELTGHDHVLPGHCPLSDRY